MTSFTIVLEPSSSMRHSSVRVWTGLAPPKVEAFCWLTMAGEISIVDNLRRKGLTLVNLHETCSLCGKKTESIRSSFVVRFLLFFGSISLKNVASCGAFQVLWVIYLMLG